MPQTDKPTVNTFCGEGQLKTFTSVAQQLILLGFFCFKSICYIFNRKVLFNTLDFSMGIDLPCLFNCLDATASKRALQMCCAFWIVFSSCTVSPTELIWKCKIDAYLENDLIVCGNSYNYDGESLSLSQDYEMKYGYMKLTLPHDMSVKTVLDFRLYTTGNKLDVVEDFSCSVLDFNIVYCDYYSPYHDRQELVGFRLLVSDEEL